MTEYINHFIQESEQINICPVEYDNSINSIIINNVFPGTWHIWANTDNKLIIICQDEYKDLFENNPELDVNWEKYQSINHIDVVADDTNVMTLSDKKYFRNDKSMYDDLTYSYKRYDAINRVYDGKEISTDDDDNDSDVDICLNDAWGSYISELVVNGGFDVFGLSHGVAMEFTPKLEKQYDNDDHHESNIEATMHISLLKNQYKIVGIKIYFTFDFDTNNTI
jgi:hypothetical protein